MYNKLWVIVAGIPVILAPPMGWRPSLPERVLRQGGPSAPSNEW